MACVTWRTKTADAKYPIHDGDHPVFFSFLRFSSAVFIVHGRDRQRCCGCCCGLCEDFLRDPPSVFLALRVAEGPTFRLWILSTVEFSFHCVCHWPPFAPSSFQEKTVHGTVLSSPLDRGTLFPCSFLRVVGAWEPQCSVHATAMRAYCTSIRCGAPSRVLRSPYSYSVIGAVLVLYEVRMYLSGHSVPQSPSIFLGVSPPRFALYLYLKPRVLSRL
jgi:hypothetical protein